MKFPYNNSLKIAIKKQGDALFDASPCVLNKNFLFIHMQPFFFGQ